MTARRNTTITRRRTLAILGGAGGTLALAPLMSACGEKELQCIDTSGLTPQQVAQREGLQYVDRSGNAAQNCANCQFYQAPNADGACGACQIMPGPVHPKGNCASWAAIQS